MDASNKGRAAAHANDNLSELKPWLLQGQDREQGDVPPETESGKDGRSAWSRRAPLLLVALSLVVVATGLILDRQEVAYTLVGKHVPGTIVDHRSLDSYGTIPFPYGGPYAITYTFATESGRAIEGRSGYYASQATDPEHRFSVQYLSVDPLTNRPFGQQDWSALYVALASIIAIAMIAFLLFLGRNW